MISPAASIISLPSRKPSSPRPKRNVAGAAFGEGLQRRIDQDRAQIDLCSDFVTAVAPTPTQRPHRDRQRETREAHQ